VFSPRVQIEFDGGIRARIALGALAVGRGGHLAFPPHAAVEGRVEAYSPGAQSKRVEDQPSGILPFNKCTGSQYASDWQPI